MRGEQPLYILQISDLHIAHDTHIGTLKEKLNSLVTMLKQNISEDSSIACCILGDIVDQGDASCYQWAEELITEFLEKMQSYLKNGQLKLFMVPGNHDLCNNGNGEKTLDCFNKFLGSLHSSCSLYSDQHMIQECDFCGYHFISLSSVKTQNHKYGELAYDQLIKCHTPPNTVMLVHHSLISSDNDDDAVIRNGYALQKFLEEHSIIALLHGHTHGCKRYTVGRDCQVIGVGPMFKSVPDISNQCNLINISGSKASEITTFTYQADRKVWDSTQTYLREENNNYFGESLYALYERILKDAESDFLLPNLRFQVKQTFEEFEQEIQSSFSSCLDDAREWQSLSCPESLDYTHGELMCTNDTQWHDFAIKKLQENPTNKRTIIPLITKEASFQSGDNKLVSFDVVQFGFMNDLKEDLYITVYMRALEVRHFLPINLCETYLMAKKLKEGIQTIKKVTVCFFVFRAEQKINYGCYKKAEIDLLNENRLCSILSDKNFTKIKTMLLEKINIGDTVVDERWLKNLQSAFFEFYKEDNRENVLKKIDESLKLLANLKKARFRCSDYSRTQVEEKQFSTSLEELTTLLP